MYASPGLQFICRVAQDGERLRFRFSLKNYSLLLAEGRGLQSHLGSQFIRQRGIMILIMQDGDYESIMMAFAQHVKLLSFGKRMKSIRNHLSTMESEIKAYFRSEGMELNDEKFAEDLNVMLEFIEHE
jgi:hypothetical protein